MTSSDLHIRVVSGYMAEIKINKSGLNEVYQVAARSLEINDQVLRKQWNNGDFEKAKPAVGASLRSIGINLPDAALTDYTNSIISGKDFEFVLQ